MPLSWFRKSDKPTRRRRPRQARAVEKLRWFLPRLEPLEERALPSLAPLPSPPWAADAHAARLLHPELVPAVSTTTTVSASADPSVFGQGVTFTASVQGSGGTPTGVVTFLDGSTTLGSGTLNAGAQATFSTSTLGVGTHSVRAVYGGNANFAGSTSSTFFQTVNQDATTTVVVSALNPAIYSQAVTFNVTVSAAGPGSGTPTGTVSLLFAIRGGLGQATLNSSGQATITTSTLVPGTYTIQASYQGDANFAAGHSPYITQTILKDSTKTAIASSVNPSAPGQAVTFTATVSANPPGLGTPTGMVAFMDGGTSFGSSTLTAGSATFTTSTLPSGTHSITAVYGGSADFSASTATVLDQTVRSQTLGKASTTTSVTSSADPSVFGEPLTFTATVGSTSPGTPTGTVTFLDGATTLGTAALNAGDQATLTNNGFPVGNQTITAVYGGDANFATSSGAFVQTVSQDGSTTVLVSSTGPSAVFGQLITFSMTVLPASPGGGVPTGTVTLDLTLRGGLGTVSLNANGVATISTSTLNVGTFTLQAVYNGDANFMASRSTSLTVIVGKDSTTTTLASSLNPSKYGQPVTFTATVSAGPPGAGTPTGGVAFLDGSITLGTGTLSNGTASYSTTSLPGGAQSITAVYGGSPDFASSASAVLNQTVILISTNTTLASLVNPSVFGQAVTFTASVSGSGGMPAGTVTFKDGATILGTATLSAGTAAFSFAKLSVGGHSSITAVYAGYANFAGSTSATLSQTVSMANTSTTVTSAVNPSVFGQPVTFTATVAIDSPGTNAAANPTGTVTFYDGGTSIGAGTLSGMATDTATFTTSALAAGGQTIGVSYGGDANFTGSAAGVLVTLASFNGTNGITPYLLVEDASGNLFGTTFDGGAYPDGTVFEIQAGTDTITTLASFNGADGANPLSLIEDTSGNLFGTTAYDGAYGGGTVFEVSAGSDAITTLASFNGPGAVGAQGLIEDSSGDLFGATWDSGTVFEVRAGSHSITTLASPGYSSAGLVEDASGDLFGVTQYGGPSNAGTVFEVGVGSGGVTTLASFNVTDGWEPTDLVGDASGDLFGMTCCGGPAGADGNVFELRAGSDSITSIASFYGNNPSSLAVDGSGNFFGTAFSRGNDGMLFELPAGSGTITTLTLFNGTNGVEPIDVVEDTKGDLFGTTKFGGASNDGTVFELSMQLIQTVNQDGTTTRLTASPSSSLISEPVTFTAIVSASAPGSGTPTGAVTFVDSTTGTTLGMATLTGGTATLSTSVSTPGMNVITASYNGDANFTTSSGTTTQTVANNSTVTLSAGSPDPSVTGRGVTFTVTVTGTGGTPTGTIMFEDNGVSIGTATLVGSDTLTLVTAILPAGTGTITAVYSGDANFSSSTSAAVTQTVNKAGTATVVTSSVNPSVFGQGVTFTATVAVLSPGTIAVPPTGTVTFYENGISIGAGTLSRTNPDRASFTTSALGVGTYPITATYSGDVNFTGSVNGGGSLQFTSPQSYTVGQNPSSETVAELRGNGVSDLIIANSVANTVSVLLGNGNGTFQSQVTYAVGAAPLSVAVGDLNGDGKPDLVVANSGIQGAGDLGLLFGNGNGTFQSQETIAFPQGSAPTAVAAVDLNGDGKLDLVVEIGEDALAVLLGNGNGTFQGPMTFSTGSGVLQFAVADLAGDGVADIITANRNDNTVSVLLGNGNGTFQPQQTYATGSEPISLAAADLTGDGKLDLAVANVTSNTVSVLLGNGNGTFQNQRTFAVGSQPYSLAVADLNGDGNLDLVTANRGGGSSGGMSVLLGNGNGTFQNQQTFFAGSIFYSSVATGDFNGDGRPDLVIGDQQGTFVDVLLNAGSGLTQTVNRDTTTTTLTSSASKSALGQPVTFTAVVGAAFPGSGTPTGTVSFVDTTTGTTLGTGILAGGTATLTTSSFSGPGTHAITADYGGDANFSAGTSATLNQTVNEASANTALTSSVNPSVYGESVTFTASVTASAGTPTGSVTFVDTTTGVTLGTSPLNALTGQATLTTTTQIAVGSENITAAYSGDTNFAPSSGSHFQTVSQSGSATMLTSSGNSVYGQTITFTTIVGPAAPGGGTPTGTLTILFSPRGGLGTLTLSGGQATVNTSTLAPGTYTMKAYYSGDTNFMASTSATLIQTVSRDSTAATVTSSSPNDTSTVGQSVTFTATVSAALPGSGTPTGQVRFLDGPATLATVSLNGGTATFTTSSLTQGLHSITVVYGGSPDFFTSTSTTLTQTVSAAPGRALTLLTAPLVSITPANTFLSLVDGSESSPGGAHVDVFPVTSTDGALLIPVRQGAGVSHGVVSRVSAGSSWELDLSELDRFFASLPQETDGPKNSI